jgi:hypothetical protein
MTLGGTPGQPGQADSAALAYIKGLAPIAPPKPSDLPTTVLMATWDNMINPPAPKTEGDAKVDPKGEVTGGKK